MSDRADRCLIRPAAPPIAAPAAPAAPAGPVVLAGAAAHALGSPPLPPLPPAPPGLVAPPALAPFAPATLPPPGHSATGAMLQDGWSNGPYWYLAYYSENELVCKYTTLHLYPSIYLTLTSFSSLPQTSWLLIHVVTGWNEGQLLGALPVLPPLVVRWPGQELWPATHPGWYAMPGGDAIWHHGQADELRLW